MVFEKYIKRFVLPGEIFTLEKKVAIGLDELNNPIYDWQAVHDLTGTVQVRTSDDGKHRGHEETGRYDGFFVPNFAIEPDKFYNYRIKHFFPVGEFIRYFRIVEMERNLTVKGKIHHYEFLLELSKEWDLKQQVDSEAPTP